MTVHALRGVPVVHLTLALIVLVVRLYDPHGWPAADRQEALAHAARSFEAAGVRIEWIVCGRTQPDPRCLEPGTPGELIVRVTRAPAAAIAPDLETVGVAVVDRASASGTVASIYTDRAEAVAAASRVPTGVVLGRALAHEIGHLLLGTTDHASRGLMRATLTQRVLRRGGEDDWRFTDEEAALLRQNLRNRTRAT